MKDEVKEMLAECSFIEQIKNVFFEGNIKMASFTKYVK